MWRRVSDKMIYHIKINLLKFSSSQQTEEDFDKNVIEARKAYNKNIDCFDVFNDNMILK